MISAVNLTKKFGDFTAVENVSLSVARGEVLLLLGPNGAGKTTTVRMLSAVLRPTSGSATVSGFDVLEQAHEVRSSVGVLTEQHGLYKRMNAFDYLKFFAQIYRMKSDDIDTRIPHLLSKFGLGDVGKKRLGEYSKGMRQKLALVRSLLHDPPVLLLDEPTSAMDPESAHIVRNAIITLRSSERTIVICTHNLAEADELADQVAIIHQGKIIRNGDPEQIKVDLLGPAAYEIAFAEELNGKRFSLPDGITVLSQAGKKMRFRVENPSIDNPILLRTLLQEECQVVTLQKIPQSLEKAYLRAIDQLAEETNV